MLKKRILSVILCLCMVVGMLPAITPTASAANNPFDNNKWQTVTYEGQERTTVTCVWYAWQQAYDNLGIEIPWRGYARDWFSNAQNCGYQTGTEPRAGAIAWWAATADNFGWGHVAYVTAASDNSITYNEGGSVNSRADSLGIFNGHTLPDGYTTHWPDGYIYLQPAATAQNIGEDFYAYIHNTYSGHALENHSNNVQLAAADNYDPRQIWHFIHLGYNQYKVINMYDGRCLDTNGTSVQVLPFVWNANQLWQICGTDSHSNSTLYYLAPPGYGTNNTNHTSVLDVAYGNDDYVPTGRDVQLSKNWYGGSGSSFINDGPFHKAQTFQIIKISQDDIKSRLAYNAGNDFYSRISFDGAYLQVMGGTGSQAYDVRTTQTFGNDPRQIWHFVRQSDGSYKIVNEYIDLVLSISGSEATDHANIQTSSDASTAAQRWYLIYSPGDSTYRITSALKYPSELYSLDIDADSRTNAQIYHQNESVNQQFSISGISYTRPSAPAAPTNIQVNATSSGTTITWDAVPTAGAYDSRDYYIYLANTKNEIFIPTTIVADNRYASDVILPDGEYFVTVRACNTKYYQLLSDVSLYNFSVMSAPVTHTISVSADPAAGGTVTGSGTYQDNVSATVTATANEGYTFKNWTESGSEVSTSATYTFTTTADRTLVAVFEKEPDVPDPPMPVITYTVSVDASPAVGGTVSGGGTYQSGASATVRAAANSGYTFKGWTKSGAQVSTDPNYTFYVTEDTLLTAVFETNTPTPTPTYTISVSAMTGGTVSGGGAYQSGTSVTVTAMPNNNYRFVEWKENGNQVSTSARYTFSADTDRTLIAVFEQIETPPTPSYTINVCADPAEGGSVSGGGSFQRGVSATVSAAPNDGYRFVCWREDGEVVSFSPGYTFSISGDTTLTAVFEKTEEPPTPSTPGSYTVTISANPSVGGSVSGGGTFSGNSTVTITATANSNYRFTGWFENGSQVSASASYTFTVSANRTLVAGFTYTGGSTITPGGKPGGSPGSSNTGSTSTSQPSLPVSTSDTNGGMTTTASPNAAAKGDTAISVITSEIAQEIIKQAAANDSSEIVIAPVIKADVSKTEITLPSTVLNEIEQKTNAGLVISTPHADVCFQNSGLSELSNKQDVIITTEQAGSVLELSITVGGQPVENVPGGIVLIVPVDRSTPGTVAVMVYEDGSRQVIRKSVADGETITIPLDGSAKVEIADNAKTFTDVSADSWAADAVVFASAHELFNGTSADRFSPDLPMTRGMLAMVLHNLENNPAQPVSGIFSDVTSDAWYSEAVAWAAARGIVSGYGNGLFGPNDHITREQLAVMLWRYAGEPAATNKELHFNDVDEVSAYALDALCWAIENGIINGKGGGVLDPRGQATRAQVAQMLMNYLRK